jgi:hypothetical protein
VCDYENPFQHITFNDNYTNTRVTMEINPDMISSADENLQKQIKTFQNKSNFISAILSKYSMFDYDNHCKLIDHISIETKVRILYAERLKYSRYYCENILPEKYRGLFRMNDYNNIYDLVKCSLIEELDSLIREKIGLLQK